MEGESILITCILATHIIYGQDLIVCEYIYIY